MSVIVSLEILEAAKEKYQAPLLAELASVGVNIRQTADLYSRGAPKLNAAAVEVLVKYFFKENYYPSYFVDGARAGIATALGVPECQKYFERFREVYEKTPDIDPFSGFPSQTKGGLTTLLSNLCVLNKVSGVGRLEELASNPAHGQVRLGFIHALNRLRSYEVLMKLVNDPVVGNAARRYLDNQEKKSGRPQNKKL